MVVVVVGVVVAAAAVVVHCVLVVVNRLSGQACCILRLMNGSHNRYGLHAFA